MEIVDETLQVERKLVAILAADVVGYSRLMSLDEMGTLTRLKALRHDVVDRFRRKPFVSEFQLRLSRFSDGG
jgi:class 3 adenylate cyclase